VDAFAVFVTIILQKNLIVAHVATSLQDKVLGATGD